MKSKALHRYEPFMRPAVTRPRSSNESKSSAVRMQDVYTVLLPAILDLCGDTIAAVRRAAARQVGRVLSISGLLASISTQPRDSSAQDVVAQVCSLARSLSFQQRVSYAHAFSGIAQQLSREDVSTLFLPSFLTLAHDPVLDVRLAVFNTLLAMAKTDVPELPCAQCDTAAEGDMQPAIGAVLKDMRVREAVGIATKDSDVVVAQMASACQKQLSNVLRCKRA